MTEESAQGGQEFTCYIVKVCGRDEYNKLTSRLHLLLDMQSYHVTLFAISLSSIGVHFKLVELYCNSALRWLVLPYIHAKGHRTVISTDRVCLPYTSNRAFHLSTPSFPADGKRSATNPFLGAHFAICLAFQLLIPPFEINHGHSCNASKRNQTIFSRTLRYYSDFTQRRDQRTVWQGKRSKPR